MNYIQQEFEIQSTINSKYIELMHNNKNNDDDAATKYVNLDINSNSYDNKINLNNNNSKSLETKSTQICVPAKSQSFQERAAKNYILVQPFGAWWNTSKPIYCNIEILGECFEQFEQITTKYNLFPNAVIQYICNMVRYLNMPSQFDYIINSVPSPAQLNLLYISGTGDVGSIYNFNAITNLFGMTNINDNDISTIILNKNVNDLNKYITINERTSNISACNPVINDNIEVYKSIVLISKAGSDTFNAYKNIMTNNPIICCAKDIQNLFESIIQLYKCNNNKNNTITSKFVPTPPPKPLTQQELREKQKECRIKGGMPSGRRKQTKRVRSPTLSPTQSLSDSAPNEDDEEEDEDEDQDEDMDDKSNKKNKNKKKSKRTSGGSTKSIRTSMY